MSRFHAAMERQRKLEAEEQRSSAQAGSRAVDVARMDGRLAQESLRHSGPAEAATMLPEAQVTLPTPLSKPQIRITATVDSAYGRIIQKLIAFRSAEHRSVVCVLSAVPREGASTVARNIVTALASDRSASVVLVDANLRTPSQHRALHSRQRGGLTDVLTGDLTLGSALSRCLGWGFTLLPSGTPTESPPHLLTRSAFRTVATTLESEFDWVIIDGPPLTTYPEAASLAGAASAALLVLRAESTRWEVAQEAKQILQKSNADILGAILNGRRYHIPGFIYRRL